MPTNRNPSPGSARMTFQWRYVEAYLESHPGLEKPGILNIGSADDPLNFGEDAMHVDIDDWSYKHKWFTKADAHALPLPDGSYDLVILGDILEHAVEPWKMVSEAARVTAPDGILVLTVFEEWRLPGPGQWIEAGLKLGDTANVNLGYRDREDFQQKNYPQRIGYDDDKLPHLVHINQFTDADMESLVGSLKAIGFEEIELLKAWEAKHEGHDWYNWLLAFRRKTDEDLRSE